jgi:hypothetical protein
VEDDLMWTKQPHEIRVAIESLETVNNKVAVLCPSFSSPNANRVNEHFVTDVICQTAVAYICKQEYYDTLIANYKEGIEKLLAGGEREKFQNDQYWKILQESPGWVFAYPTLGQQTPSFSDILKKDVDYTGAYNQILCINSH